MLAIDLIEDFRAILNESSGNYLVPKSAVLAVLESYEAELGEDTFGEASKKSRIDNFYVRKREYSRQVHESELETFKVINIAGQSAIRSTFIMNGGAAVATAALIGTISSTPDSPIQLSGLAIPLGVFAVGVFMSAVSFAMTYLAMFYGGYEETGSLGNKLYKAFNSGAVISGFLSLASFATGLYCSYNSLTGILG